MPPLASPSAWQLTAELETPAQAKAASAPMVSALKPELISVAAAN